MNQRIMMIGPVGHGKTSLIQALETKTQEYNKTQDIIYSGKFIDTPGEFVQHRHFNNALQVTSQDASLLCFVLDARSKEQIFSPNYAQSFNKPVIGIVTHIDVATDEEIINASKELLKAGTNLIFNISTVSGDGIDELKKYLTEV
ncbi:EutP/PduV family microcompartment system protein [Ignavigranum ruoffiae]|uniref:Ethanolamine utilization protein EutP n=1 Tax=Ignavigranum ruoffiae TaxID=89093 RepID=A0A1H9GHS7_9LACT|nr:EutP/PduV family microcompartment system protein [Ignavigranum ruoffiae]SEQ49654.1 ethanolamine utilization protein EutP [Ignavigranum ruoffiae]